MKAIAILLTVLCLGGTVAYAQQREKDRGHGLLSANSEGTHFFIGFMQNEDDMCARGFGERSIMIASRFSTSVIIRYPDGTATRDDIPAGQLRSYQVNSDYECIGEGVYRKGIEIIATHPVCVYCYSSKPQTSDGYLALPVDVWGTEYVSANYSLDHYSIRPGINWLDSVCQVSKRRGEFMIIASEDNTQVNVIPATPTLESGASRLLTRTLMKGDVYQVQDGGEVRGYSDLTGSVITSNKPVGLLSGHMRAGVPYFYDTKDHLIEMIPPRQSLGKRLVAVPFGGRQGGDLIRVISSESDPTNVTITSRTGVVTRTITRLGGYIDYDLQSVSVIVADRPVLVTQYARSQGADPRNHDTVVVAQFDPDMVVVTPEEQFVQTAVFQTMPNYSPAQFNQQYREHYVTIVAERDKFSTITLNGQPLVNQPGFVGGDIAGTPFRWAWMQVADGRVHVLSGDALFGGYVYGLGEFDSYAWPIGAKLPRTSTVDSIAPVLTDTLECGGVLVRASEIGTGQAGLKRVWLDSAGSVNTTLRMTPLMLGDEYGDGHITLIDPRKAGKARVIAEDQAGNRDTLDIDVAISTPLNFNRDSILFADAEIATTYSTTLVITNANGIPLVIDSLYLKRRREFTLLKSYKGTVIPSGGSLGVEVYFQTVVRREQRDTLVVITACQAFTIPMYASVAAPQIGTHDLEFGRVRVGNERILRLRVWNSGRIPLRLDSAVQVDGPFAIRTPITGPIVLMPKTDSTAEGDTTIDVAFSPTAVGDFAGTVRFYSNADTVAIAHLHGVGVYPAIQIGGYDFGRMQVGDTGCTRIPIVNTGTDTAHLTGLGLPDPNIFIPDVSLFPFSLPPGDTLWVRVCFSPREEAIYTADVLPLNDDRLEAMNKLRGAGYILRGWLSGHDWHERWIGPVWHDSVVYLHNFSDAPLTVYKVWLGSGDVGDFKVEALLDSVVIAPRDSSPVNVSFSPMLPGVRSCMIHALTSSRTTTIVDSVLQGFGLMAMASDTLRFDGSMAYSCSQRSGTLTIHNDGNTQLTLNGIRLSSTPSIAKLESVPPPGFVVDPGDSIVVNFNVNMAGFEGTVSGELAWSFMELPDTIRRPFVLESRDQYYSILANTPRSVGIGGRFDVVVHVDSSFWRNVPRREVVVAIDNNPTVARFDITRWNERAAQVASGWAPVGAPVFDMAGRVRIRFRPLNIDALPLDSVFFLAFPYEGFLGNSTSDTFRVTLIPVESECGPPAMALVPYSIDSICGLSDRLIQITGTAYALKQSRPNPSSTVANIEFTLGMEAQTTLQVFAADGRLVRTLVDQVLPAGVHTVPLEVRTLSSGIYYYRLTSGPFGAVRSLMVAK